MVLAPLEQVCKHGVVVILEWPAEHPVQSSSGGIAALRSSVKGWVSSGTVLRVQSQIRLGEQLSTILISVLLSVGEKVFLVDAPLEALWTSEEWSSAPREYPLSFGDSCTAFGGLIQYYLCLVSAVTKGDSFWSQSLTVNHSLTVYSMDLLWTLNSWNLPGEFFHSCPNLVPDWESVSNLACQAQPRWNWC